MTILRYLAILVVLEVVLGGFNRSICRNEADGKHYLLHDSIAGRTAREIPDDFTLKDLNTTTSWTSQCSLNGHVVGTTVPSLQMANQYPDEWMRVTVHKARALNPINITEEHYETGYFNPCMMEWRGRTLLAFPMVSIRIVWVEKGSTHKISNETLYGFGPEFGWFGTPDYNHKEDPRLLAMSNGSLLLTYSDLHDKTSYYFYVIFTFNEVTQQLEHTSGILGENQKNWVFFEASPKTIQDSSLTTLDTEKDKKELFLIQLINPYKVFGWYPDEKTGVMNYHAVQTTNVPMLFPAYAGNSYRGSSNAIFVNGVNLIVFHTRTLIQAGAGRMTYFMGAMTFCPTYPFNIHSMSEYPILEPGWYDGPWMNTRHDYIVYPTGVVLTKDRKRLIVSSGYQDHFMRILSFDVSELFESLVVIQEC